jgi:hypothetical protein
VLIRSLLAERDLPDTAGLRLGTDDDTHALAMDLIPAAREDDVVLLEEGVSVFLSPFAAVRTEGQTLHAQVDGRPAFYLD